MIVPKFRKRSIEPSPVLVLTLEGRGGLVNERNGDVSTGDLSYLPVTFLTMDSSDSISIVQLVEHLRRTESAVTNV
jgi:hypothetical protein